MVTATVEARPGVVDTAVQRFLSSDHFTNLPLNTKLAQKYDLRSFTQAFADYPHYPTPEEVETHFKSKLDPEKFKVTTARRHFESVKALYGWLAEEGEIKEGDLGSPFRGVKDQGEPRRFPMTDEEAKELLEAAIYSPRRVGKRDAAIFTIGMQTGARVKELADLTTEEVIPTHSGVLVTLGKVDTKRRRAQLIADKPSANLVMEYQKDLKGEGRFFRNIHHFNKPEEGITRQGIWLVLKNYGDRLGFTLAPEALRQYYLIHQAQ